MNFVHDKSKTTINTICHILFFFQFREKSLFLGQKGDKVFSILVYRRKRFLL